MVDAAVLALVSRQAGRVLVVRKKCPSPSPWACDIALPGGRIKPGESPIETALREAWEEACIHPSTVDVRGVIGYEKTLSGGLEIAIVYGEPRGPIDPKPCDNEVDSVAWISLSILEEKARLVEHPVRGKVYGYHLPGNLILWGVTLRILKIIKQAIDPLRYPLPPKSHRQHDKGKENKDET
ncbi:MAG: NUDIX domain-containing protein [Desulfurococcales archaeon]|nr:NUDIX domain-containing protein [Desulfurococcales archaeon]